MRSRGKLKKFAAIREFSNILEFPQNIAGKWRSDVYKNTHPLFVELACGKGEYTRAMAKAYPKRNCLGVDIKGDRLYLAAKRASVEQLDNARFMRAPIELLNEFFAPQEMDEMWIVFPDPFPKGRHRNKRLTAPYFLEIYKKLVKPSGLIHLKTDSHALFEYSLDSITAANFDIHVAVSDIYNFPTLPHPLLAVQTTFENLWRSQDKSIHYIQFSYSTK